VLEKLVPVRPTLNLVNNDGTHSPSLRPDNDLPKGGRHATMGSVKLDLRHPQTLIGHTLGEVLDEMRQHGGEIGAKTAGPSQLNWVVMMGQLGDEAIGITVHGTPPESSKPHSFGAWLGEMWHRDSVVDLAIADKGTLRREAVAQPDGPPIVTVYEQTRPLGSLVQITEPEPD
jgi:hypothetical protein